MKRTAILLFIAAAAFGAIFAAKPVTVVFTVNPPMHCNSCETRIKSNLRFEKGVKKINTILDSNYVEVTFDPAKGSTAQLIKGFEKIGYAADSIR